MNIIYHYSSEKHKVLKTRKKQGIKEDQSSKEQVLKDKLLKLPGTYNDHISFFTAPIPYEFLGTIFGNEHDVWYPGSKLIEHKVLVDSLPDMFFRLVESPEVTEYFYSDESMKVSDEEYWKHIASIEINNGYRGTTISELKNVCSKFNNSLLKYFLELKKYPNWNDIKLKYAATVPHLMIYPKGGIINVSSFSEITIGNKKIPNFLYA